MRGTVKKDGTSWFILFDIGKDPLTGKRKQKKKRGFKTKKEAEKYLSEQLNAVDKGTFFEPKDITFSEYLDYWFDNYAKPNTAVRTLENYNYIITNHIKPSLGGIKIAKLHPSHLQEYYSQKLVNGKLDGQGLSAQSVKHHHRLIHKALKDAVKWQFLGRNIAQAVTPPKVKKVEMKIWDNIQVKTFLKAAKTSAYYPIYLTAIYTGMRRGEVLGIRWQDIDFDNNIIYIRQSLQEVKKLGLTFKEPKSGKSRSITITTLLTKELKKLHKQQLEFKLLFGKEYHDLDLVFAQKNGKPIQPTEMARDYRKVVDNSGLPYIRFHDLRHTHATLMLQQGVHPKVVSERLGHSTIGITMDTYTHVLPNMQKEAAHQFEQLIK
ncbi:site-specific integrase [Neobacillus sp. 179-C4.2 HS]|uniref:Site-specific integrase n=1 Tax=Neobacillus driksii TaxID=3035913 RepID=A0ABV4YT54_9BACI|nr:site-specific integrase [Neobacillus sp. 179.-C4.2 HS]MDP5195057.1 site-specific integrase [Neobacillus sp. 179.-C4.2 HS]